MAYDSKSYYGRRPENIEFGLSTAFAVVLLTALAIVLVAYACTPTPTAADDSEGVPAASITLDTADADTMHHLGMPTRVDVIGYHMYGHWAWSETVDGYYTVHTYQSLPGDAAQWDLLYGLDPDNPDYKH